MKLLASVYPVPWSIDKSVTLRLVQNPRNSDFVLESIIVELNQYKKTKPPDWPDAVWKRYFISKMNKQQNQIQKFLQVFNRIVVLKVYKNSQKKTSHFHDIFQQVFLRQNGYL